MRSDAIDAANQIPPWRRSVRVAELLPCGQEHASQGQERARNGLPVADQTRFLTRRPLPCTRVSAREPFERGREEESAIPSSLAPSWHSVSYAPGADLPREG